MKILQNNKVCKEVTEKSTARSAKTNSSMGFTVVESLVATAILSLSILASFAAVRNGIQSSTIAKDQITAFYLAQEGVEYIKNIRDENALFSLNEISNNRPPRSWLYGLSDAGADPCYFGRTCRIDSFVGRAGIQPCSGGFSTCPDLRQDTATKLFGYNGAWPATSFKREIQLVQVSSTEISIIMSMTWRTMGKTKSFQVTQSLFDRQ